MKTLVKKGRDFTKLSVKEQIIKIETKQENAGSQKNGKFVEI